MLFSFSSFFHFLTIHFLLFALISFCLLFYLPALLVAYDSGDDSDGQNQNDSHDNSDDDQIDSDEELERSIASKVRAWPRKAERYLAEGRVIRFFIDTYLF